MNTSYYVIILNFSSTFPFWRLLYDVLLRILKAFNKCTLSIRHQSWNLIFVNLSSTLWDLSSLSHWCWNSWFKVHYIICYTKTVWSFDCNLKLELTGKNLSYGQSERRLLCHHEHWHDHVGVSHFRAFLKLFRKKEHRIRSTLPKFQISFSMFEIWKQTQLS